MFFFWLLSFVIDYFTIFSNKIISTQNTFVSYLHAVFKRLHDLGDKCSFLTGYAASHSSTVL
uniref:Uncharacterized protein n=1 Tax=Anguilla anguilla TaxID=7936 RepID=A0A0E9XLN7_ANGAN